MIQDPPLSPPARPASKGDVTRLLEGWAKGDADALDQLFSRVFDELRAMARGQLAREGHYVSFQPTDLVGEVCKRMLMQKEVHWECRGQFFALSSKLMRRILVDRARRRQAAKRRGDEIPVDPDLFPSDEWIPRVLILDGALTELEALDPLDAAIVEMRFYGGWTIPEIAAALKVSPTTVKRRWSGAQLWLRRYFRQQQ